MAARALPGDVQLRRTDDAGGWRVCRIRSHREPPVVIGSGHRGYNRALAAYKPREPVGCPGIGAVTPAGPRPAARGHHPLVFVDAST